MNWPKEICHKLYSLWEKNKEEQNEKRKKNLRGFSYPKKWQNLWNISLDHFIKHKLLIFEECTLTTTTNFLNFTIFQTLVYMSPTTFTTLPQKKKANDAHARSRTSTARISTKANTSSCNYLSRLFLVDLI